MTISKKQISIMEHTRDRAAFGFYCGGGSAMHDLVAKGLMVFAGRKSFVPDDYFTLTEAGREFLRGLAK